MRAELDEVGRTLRHLVLDEFELVEEVNDYLLLMRGKMFRPTLLLLGNQIGGKPSKDAILVAAVVEALHLATLVHDDAVDHSVLRRGMPTLNSLWGHQVAIIMGDYLYSRSVIEMAQLGRVDLIQVLAEAANTMTIGEMRQLSCHEALDFQEEDYYRVISAKTASLMAAACELGAMLGDSRYRDSLRQFGYALGMAFQIADDILDYTEAEEVTGKPSGHDLREHKVTLPLIAALRDFGREEQLVANALFSDPKPDDAVIIQLIEAVESRGGLDYARAKARSLAGEALAAIEHLPASPSAAALAETVDYVVERRN